MRLYKLLSFFFVLCLFSNLAIAEEIEIIVKLVHIEVEKTSEASGDEVYFNISQHPSWGAAEEARIPIYPEHWLSKQLPKVHNLVLWKGFIKEGGSVRLILSLMEQEMPPFDVDDLLGSAELTLINHQGKLKKHWAIPVSEESKEVEMRNPSEVQRFVFKGAGARYDVGFSIETKQVTKENVKSS